MKKSHTKQKCPIRSKSQLKSAVKQWAKNIKVNPAQIRVQKMKRKWASCSTKGWVSFSEDLLKESRVFQDYVIAHELLHLQIPNHGKLFKSMMNIFLPGWEKIESSKSESRIL